MPEDYGKAVLAAYQKKKEDESLSSNLLNPTPGSLREECLIVYRERELTPKDDEILRQFFGATEQGKGYFTLINSSFASKFKQMPKIIKGKVPNPGIKFIELLAWLIDFQPRTSISYYNSFDRRYNEETKKVIDNPDDRTEERQTEVIVENDNHSNKNEGIIIDEEANKQGDLVEEVKEATVESTEIGVARQPIDIKEGEEETIKVDYTGPEYVRLFSPRYIIISCIILLFIGSSSFMAWENSTTSVRMPNADEKCMYWNEDHYEPVKCNAQIANATIIPLDLKKLQRQRKINLSDTLTSYSLGKVWYKGFVKDHEFFTAAGTYPTDTTRVLRKLTPIILAKYISNNRYLQTRLIWLSYAIIFVAICGFGASRLKKEVQPPEAKPEVVEQEIRDFIQPQAVNC